MIFDDPDGPAADLRGTISQVLTDLAEAAWLPGGTPGETARAAVTLDRLAAELAEAAAMTRALPGRPAQAASHTRAATAALRTAARAEADVAGWLAGILTTTAREQDTSLTTSPPPGWAAWLLRQLVTGQPPATGEPGAQQP